jgi:hypothetical protein
VRVKDGAQRQEGTHMSGNAGEARNAALSCNDAALDLGQRKDGARRGDDQVAVELWAR